jgi:SAM-dependent methyltransferase
MESRAWDERYAGRELVWSSGPNQFLVAEVDDEPPGRALDLACGEGRNAIWLAEKGWDVTGVDFSAVGLAKAARLAEERGVHVRWVEADVIAWDPPAGGFDLVAVFYLQLAERPRTAALTRAAAAVAPGGTLLLVAHDADNLVRGFGGPQDPAVLYRPGEVAALLAGEGLSIEKAEQVGRSVATEEGERMAIDVLVRAHRPAAAA